MNLTDWHKKNFKEQQLLDIIFRIFDGYLNAGMLHGAMRNENISIADDLSSVTFGDTKGYSEYFEPIPGDSVETADVYCLGLLLASALGMKTQNKSWCLENIMKSGKTCAIVPTSHQTELYYLVADMTALRSAERPDMQLCCNRLLKIREYSVKLRFVDKDSNVLLSDGQQLSVTSLITAFRPESVYSFGKDNGNQRKYRPCSDAVINIPCWKANGEYTIYLEQIRFNPDSCHSSGEFKNERPSVGMDIGSSCTSVSYVDNSACCLRTVRYSDNPRIPSDIILKSENKISFGVSQADVSSAYSDSVIHNLREHIRVKKNCVAYSMQGRARVQLSSVAVMSLYMRFLESGYRKQCSAGYNDGQLVIAVPDDYTLIERRNFSHAFTSAGFSPLLITESEAVAFYFAIGINHGDNVLVADMGRDSLKVTVFRAAVDARGKIMFEKLSFHRQNECGGAVYSLKIQTVLEKYAKEKLRINTRSLTEERSTYNSNVFFRTAEELKLAFSGNTEDTVRLTVQLYYNNTDASPATAEFLMSRSELDIIAEHSGLTKSVSDALGRALTGARLSLDEVNHLYMAGGGFLLPAAMKPVCTMFSDRHCKMNYASHAEAVSRGAARYAALHSYYMEVHKNSPIPEELGVLVDMYVGGKAVFVPLIPTEKMDSGSVRMSAETVSNGKEITIFVYTRPVSRRDVVGTLSSESNCIKKAFALTIPLTEDISLKGAEIEFTLTAQQDGTVLASAELISRTKVKKWFRAEVEETRTQLCKKVFTPKR